MKIVISPGHGAPGKIEGAEGPAPWGLNEVKEARRVVDRVVELLRSASVDVDMVKDDVSTNQDDNLDYLISEHNKRTRDRDVSIHFNHNGTTDGPRGTETYYGSSTGREIAADVASEIAIASGLTDRGAKDGSHLKWVRETEMPAVLVEVAFVNAREDCERYHAHFEAICRAIAEAVGEVVIGTTPPPIRPPEPPPLRPERPENVPIDQRPTLRQGDEGDDVLDMQRMIPRF